MPSCPAALAPVSVAPARAPAPGQRPGRQPHPDPPPTGSSVSGLPRAGRSAQHPPLVGTIADLASPAPAIYGSRRGTPRLLHRRARFRLGSRIRFTGTCSDGMPRRSSDGHLIPEGTYYYAITSYRCGGSAGLEHAGAGQLPARPIWAIVPGHSRDRSDLLPLYQGDYPVRAIYHAGGGHCRRLLDAKYRPDAGYRHSKRARGPLTQNPEEGARL